MSKLSVVVVFAVAAALALASVGGRASAQAVTPISSAGTRVVTSDYVFTPSADPNAARRASNLVEIAALTSFVDLAAAGYTNLPPGQYARNVTLPGGFFGGLTLTAQVDAAIVSVEEIIFQLNAQQAVAQAANPPLAVFDDYLALYTYFNNFQPTGYTEWQLDPTFSLLRMMAFPFYIARVPAGATLPEFVTSQYSTAQNLAFADDIRHGRLFVEDFRAIHEAAPPRNPNSNVTYILHRIQNPASAQSQPLPVGLLWDGVWYKPDGSAMWLLAKINANVMEGGYTAVEHLLFHVALSPIITAATIALGDDGVLYNLLAQPADPNNYANVAIAWEALFSSGTQYDQIAWLGALGGNRYVDYRMSQLSWSDRDFETDMARRGMAGVGAYQYYGVVSDYQQAYKPYVSATLRGKYPTDASVADDGEIQRWASVVESPSGGRVWGFPTEFRDVDTLVATVTQIYLIPINHMISSSRMYPNVQLFLPGVPWQSLCPRPATADAEALVDERWIVANCYPGLASALAQYNHGLSFIREYSAWYSLGFAPWTARTGMTNVAARTQLSLALQAIQLKTDLTPRTGAVPNIFCGPFENPCTDYN